MNLDRFTEKAMAVLGNAQNIALQRDHQHLTPLHLLQAFLDDSEGYAKRLLAKAGVRVKDVAEKVEEELQKLPQVTGSEQIYADKAFQTIMAKAEKESQSWGDSFIAADTLLYVTADQSSKAADILKAAGLNTKAFKEVIMQERGGQQADSKSAEDTQGALARYTRDVTAEAASGKSDPVIGREEIGRAHV